MRLYLGTQGWSYPDWTGSLYDAGMPPASYLRAYAAEFGSVEVDSSFYGTPRPQTLAKWAAAVGDEFRFALKVPREITHERRLRAVEPLAAEFFTVACTLGAKLGAVLVQFPPDFSPEERPALEAFLPLLPREVRIAVEVRDPRWFEDDRLIALLRRHERALVVSDGTFIPLEHSLELLRTPTADFAYVRWLGVWESVTRYDRVVFERDGALEQWAEALRATESRLDACFGYANNHYQGHAPATVRGMLAALGIEHHRPHLIEQPELFS